MPDHRILMFHGTSDVFLPRIMEDGLLPNPPAKLSALMAKGTGHTVSFPGTYFSTRLSLAAGYAKGAAKDFGGSPILIASSLDVASLIPDEDEILYMLEGNLVYVLGYDPEEDEKPLLPWSRDMAEELARWFADLGSVNQVDVSAVADRIDALISPVTGDGWDRSPELFHPDFNSDGWSSPEWARKLTATPEGMDLYRRNMDGLARLLAGMDPYNFPCEIDGCKGRVDAPVRIDGPDDGNFIFAIGRPGDLTCLFDRCDRVTGDEAHVEAGDDDCLDAYLPEAARWIRPGIKAG